MPATHFHYDLKYSDKKFSELNLIMQMKQNKNVLMSKAQSIANKRIEWSGNWKAQMIEARLMRNMRQKCALAVWVIHVE